MSINQTTFLFNSFFRKSMSKPQLINNNIYIRNNENKCKAPWDTMSSTVTNNIRKNDIRHIGYKKQDINSNPADICKGC